MDPGLRKQQQMFKTKIGNYSFALADSSQPTASVSKKSSHPKSATSIDLTKLNGAPKLTAAATSLKLTDLAASEQPVTIPKPSNDAADLDAKSKRDAILKHADAYTNARAHRDQLAALGLGTSSSGKQFSVLQKVVTHMRDRFLKGESQALSVDEMLDELGLPHGADSELQNGVTDATRNWLEYEALPNNAKMRLVDPKEEVSNGASASAGDKRRFVFKPPYQVRDRKGLLNLLQRFAMDSQGGLLLDDLAESFAGARSALQAFRDQGVVEFVERADRRMVVFFDDVRDSRVPLDPEFSQLFVGCTVQQLDERQIENYLKERGLLTSFDDPTPAADKNAAKSRKRKRQKPAIRDNEHLASALHDYGDSL